MVSGENPWELVPTTEGIFMVDLAVLASCLISEYNRLFGKWCLGIGKCVVDMNQYIVEMKGFSNEGVLYDACRKSSKGNHRVALLIFTALKENVRAAL
jgi:hypothetical protein